MQPSATILWARLDRPGHEAARLSALDIGWSLAGTAVFAHTNAACRLDYRIICDAAFRTRSAAVTGWIGAATTGGIGAATTGEVGATGSGVPHAETPPTTIDLAIEVDGDGRWRMNGIEQTAVVDCEDIDLNFSPSTNLLPIRRLNLEVGASAAVRAAWLRFPGFTLELLEQVYTRTGVHSYRYESNGGRFASDLEVDVHGFVTVYPNLWVVASQA